MAGNILKLSAQSHGLSYTKKNIYTYNKKILLLVSKSFDAVHGINENLCHNSAENFCLMAFLNKNIKGLSFRLLLKVNKLAVICIFCMFVKEKKTV